MNERLKELLLGYAQCEPETVTRLTAAGSNRVYYRFTFADGHTVVGVEGTNPDENRAFLTIGRHLHKAGLPVPQILAESDCGMYYLLEDLGDESLFGFMESARESGQYSPEQTALLEKVMRLLPDLQFKGGKGLDYSVCGTSTTLNTHSSRQPDWSFTRPVWRMTLSAWLLSCWPMHRTIRSCTATSRHVT